MMKTGTLHPRESPEERRHRARRIFRKLQAAYPDARCELDFSNPLELLIAAILSAQSTDRRVNMVTPALFSKYRTAADWARVPQEQLEGEIKSTGFFRNKARAIRALVRELVEKHGGGVPEDFEALVALPGVGRKTANLVMVSAFGKPGIIVDTHCSRVAQRLGFTRNTDPEKIEQDLGTLIPRKDWGRFSHCMVFHGRYCCKARRPECDRCPVADGCPSRTA